MIGFLFSTSQKVGARLIRWGLETDVSHFAMLFHPELGPHAVVVESRLETGVRLTWLREFARTSKVVNALALEGLPREEVFNLYCRLVDHVAGKEYDKLGILWLSVSVLRKKLGLGEAKASQWGDRNDLFCVEILQAYEKKLKALGVPMDRYDPQMLTPDRAREILLESPKFVDKGPEWVQSLLSRGTSSH